MASKVMKISSLRIFYVIFFILCANVSHAAVPIFHFDIPQQNASDALTALGQQADISVIYQYDVIVQFRTNRLKGRYSLSRAVNILLLNSGLQAEFGEGGRLVISVSSDVGVEGDNSVHALLSDDSNIIEEITVTSEKRETLLQSTPIAITAVTPDVVEITQVEDIRDLQMLAPSITFNNAPAGTQVYIRGVGQDDVNVGQNPGVAIYVDGVYHGHGFTNTAAFQDADRFEVLRGPQGTLYGRNSTGGNINITRKKPTFEATAKLTGSIGNYGAKQCSISGSTGIVDDVLAVRGFYLYKGRDGYAKNLVNGDDVDAEDLNSTAVSLLYTPSDDLEVILRGDYQKSDTHNRPRTWLEDVPGVLPPGVPGPLASGARSGGRKTRDVYGDITTTQLLELWGVSGSLSWNYNDLVLSSVVSYRNSRRDSLSDSDGTDLPLLTIDLEESAEEYSVEVNLVGNALDERLDWIVGVNYYSDDASLYAVAPVVSDAFGSLTALRQYSDELESMGLFAQANYHLTDRLRVTAGARYSKDERDAVLTGINTIGNARVSLCENSGISETWETPTFKLGFDYDLTEDAMLYGAVSSGFKAGGINATVCNDTYDEEAILAYELGFKSAYLDHRMTLNGAFYFYDYTDMQIRTWFAGQANFDNAGESRIYGAEFEFVAKPSKGFQVAAGLSIQNAEFTDAMIGDNLILGDPDVDVSGNALLRAPDLKAQLVLQQSFELKSGGSIHARYDVLYTSEYYGDAFERDITRIDSNTLQDFRLTWRDGLVNGWMVQLYVKNLTDEEYLEWILPSDIGGVIGMYAPPRTLGLRVSYSL
ncbi:TonB-dependent receptor domain-containing protein [Maricurvus nonylphenolicus]|uniref:TonB-dependent receptor domain-containing protein n=1 Tax=Maricurvus nonylphenolicus TaxID=1008307 RepID=UPI0036F3C50A